MPDQTSQKLTAFLEDVFVVECRDKDGNLKWRDVIENLVVDAGINDMLDKYFRGSSYTASHYIGLTGGSPTFNAADTMSSHSGWSEVTAYSQSTRPQATWGTVSGKQVSNSGSPAQFTINANNTTIGGAFITTNNTKGGTTGTLYGGGAFSGGNKTLSTDDTLSVTVTASGSSS